MLRSSKESLPTAAGTTSADGGDAGGLLLVDKPAGVTSHDVVALARRALRTRRVGHAGTLDPFATGLLVILSGRGTRLIPYVDGEPKVYEATIRFGSETDTDDATGTATRESDVVPDNASIAEGIARLTGAIDQVPPAYSAKQVGGTRAYAAARRGEPLDLRPVAVTVHRWEVLGREGNSLSVRITCGGGTYIRALARDLGRLAGGAAHLEALRRVAAGPFTVEGAATIEALRAGAVGVRPLRDAIPSFPVQSVDESDLARVRHGNDIGARVAGDRVALIDHEQTLIAVAARDGDRLRPRLVLVDG